MAPQNTNSPPSGRTNGRNDRSPWNWLLAIAVVVPLLTFLYNRIEPRLAGIPYFYWGQLAFLLLGVIASTVVYQATKSKKGS